jgi:hypothetical protein
VAVILEVKAGPMSGEKIVVRNGETVTFGRAAGRANFALPHDTFMSGVHFAVVCGPQGPILNDRNSSNGTFLNGARVKDSPLTNGDEVRSGNTSFSVRFVADDKLPQAATPVAAAPPIAQDPARPAPRPPAPVAPLPAPEPVRNVDDFFSASVVQPPALRPQAPAVPVQPQAAPIAPPEPPMPRATPPTSPSSSLPQAPRPQIPSPPVAPPSRPIPSQPAARAPEPPRSAPVAASAKPPIFTVGSWAFSEVPKGWTVKAEFGMEQAEKEGFPSSVTATEEMIGGNPALGPFVESQLSMLRQYLREPKIEAAIPPTIPGAEEKASVDVRYLTNDGQTIFYRRLYARTGNTVGTITLMTLDAEFPSIRPAFDAIVGGVTFQPKTGA